MTPEQASWNLLKAAETMEIRLETVVDGLAKMERAGLSRILRQFGLDGMAAEGSAALEYNREAITAYKEARNAEAREERVP